MVLYGDQLVAGPGSIGEMFGDLHRLNNGGVLGLFLFQREILQFGRFWQHILVLQERCSGSVDRCLETHLGSIKRCSGSTGNVLMAHSGSMRKKY